MRITRLYTPTLEPAAASFVLQDKQTHYVANVLRKQVGEQIYLFNGKESGDYLTTIVSRSKKTIELSIEQFVQRAVSPREITLVLAIVRGDRMDFALQKATELGVTCIVPIYTEYSVPAMKPSALQKKQQHWQGVVASACEQSWRVDLPDLVAPQPLQKWCQENQAVLAKGGRVLSLYGQPVKETCHGGNVWLVGPEGGWSEQEELFFEALHIQKIKFGPYVLRAETAATVAMTLANVIPQSV